LFLWHLPVLTGLYDVSGIPLFGGGLLPLLAVGLPISLALAWLSLRLVELPAMRWAARRSPLPRVTHRG
jgi:peptidoglycan/LPS O-acetylase OafA/YrhL